MNYSQMSKAALIREAKNAKIVGRWDMSKEELINALIHAERDSTIMIDASQYKDTSAPQKSTMDYTKNAEPGTIVAFKIMLGGKQRVLSAVINANEEDYLLVQTKNGSKYRILPEDIIWVKTGLRWPRWVLESLKGLSSVPREEHKENDDGK